MLSFTNLTRRTIENLFLFVLFVGLYSMFLGTIPPKLELFEGWVDVYLPLLREPFDVMWREFWSIKPNDSNQSVNAPVWLALIDTSLFLFGQTLVAYRVPGVLLTALAPVFTAELVRRYFRADLALWVGLLVGAHQHIIAFARTGGYIGPTLTLFLAILLCSAMIAVEKKRWPWIPLAFLLALVPFFYATVRYFALIGVLLIAYQFVRSRDFRRRHVLPIAATSLLLAAVGLGLTHGGRLDLALVFISARGEQFLITDKTLYEGFETESLRPEFRLSGLVNEMIPNRVADLGRFYGQGSRFFNHRYHAVRHQVWVEMGPWINGFMLLGVLRCIVASFTQARYLIPVLCSILAWVPLLVTTGITPNRMLLGIPADMLILVLGVYAPVDLLSRFAPARIVWFLTACLWLLFVALAYHSVSTYFMDYVAYPNL